MKCFKTTTIIWKEILLENHLEGQRSASHQCCVEGTDASKLLTIF